MPLVDSSDFKSGFWLGLGLILAFMVVGFVQLFARRATRKPANG